MTELGDAQNENENINEEGYFYVLNKEREKDQKKKQKKKKEILDHEDGNEIQKARKKDKRINGDGEGRELLQGLKEAQMIREENMNLKMIGSKDLRNNSELGMKREKKKKHKEEKRAVSSRKEVLEDNKSKVAVEGKIYPEKRVNDERKDRKEDLKTEKKRKREMEGVDVLAKNNMVGGEVEMERELSDGKNVEKARPVKKKRRKEKENRNGDVGAGLPETILTKTSDKKKGVEVDQSVGNESSALSSSNETGEGSLHANSTKDHNKDVKQKKKKKKKVESDKHVSERNHDKGVPRTRNDVEATYENSTPGGTSKRVSFSDHVEVFTSSDDPFEGKSDQDSNFVRGKRFSEEEDEILKKAVFNYIEAHDLGDEGLNMVLHCKSNPEVRNCWKEIRAALPWRPSDSIYYRAHILFERGEKRKWTQEEYEFIRNHHEKHGSEWKMMADAIGKHRFHVKDTWRRIKLSNRKKGRWSQDEYQKLFDLVNMDLRMRVFEEKKSKHGMLRDNISWEAISQKLSTRPNFLCCQKWYSQLSSPMVAEGIWVDTDDYRLVDALYSLDACCIEDVDWDNLLEHRSGDVCRRRWDQMLKHIGEHANKSYAEQVEVLSKRYCTDVLEAREAYDSKPAVS
ncbi:Cyclin-D-binding Myb-like transcription factor 1 [Morella rubra]|uniref:Cyclin-D-binding Myb-like transcription factor 1 n=1 Tax=Morella rubra TaxID=262757 RepID=A0A6A1V174_9ROSI|nr:Cyclin-D-binding Myb-like transcription factor 1 [Morella rubra]